MHPLAMDRACKPSGCTCRSTNCCRWIASANSFLICSPVGSRRGRWPTGSRRQLARLAQQYCGSKSCCWHRGWIMWMKRAGESKGCCIGAHVNATRWLTLYHWHRNRGQKAIDSIGILPQYSGRAMHDRLSSYDHYGCEHSICSAHLLRDCLLIVERDHQPWAQEMHDLLRRMVETTARFRAMGARVLPQSEPYSLVFQYF